MKKKTMLDFAIEAIVSDKGCKICPADGHCTICTGPGSCKKKIKTALKKMVNKQ